MIPPNVSASRRRVRPTKGRNFHPLRDSTHFFSFIFSFFPVFFFRQTRARTFEKPETLLGRVRGSPRIAERSARYSRGHSSGIFARWRRSTRLRASRKSQLTRGDSSVISQAFTANERPRNAFLTSSNWKLGPSDIRRLEARERASAIRRQTPFFLFYFFISLSLSLSLSLSRFSHLFLAFDSFSKGKRRQTAFDQT